jgi:hypothetical protein
MEVSAQLHTKATLPPGKESSVPNGPQEGYGHSGEEKNPYPCRESNPGRSVTILSIPAPVCSITSPNKERNLFFEEVMCNKNFRKELLDAWLYTNTFIW